MIEIVIDESIQRIDKKLWKTSVCCVEFEDKKLRESVQSLKVSISEDKVRFPDNGNKLHFSEMNDAQKTIVIELVSKLPLTAKVYTYYSVAKNEAEAKQQAMQGAVAHIEWLHRTKETDIKIEYANEYATTALKDRLFRDSFIFILPDAILSVYCKHLNDIRKNSTSANAQFYALLKAKIRLQTFILERHTEYNEKGDRI